jgi:hypothetical protein
MMVAEYKIDNAFSSELSTLDSVLGDAEDGLGLLLFKGLTMRGDDLYVHTVVEMESEQKLLCEAWVAGWGAVTLSKDVSNPALEDVVTVSLSPQLGTYKWRYIVDGVTVDSHEDNPDGEIDGDDSYQLAVEMTTPGVHKIRVWNTNKQSGEIEWTVNDA